MLIAIKFIQNKPLIKTINNNYYRSGVSYDKLVKFEDLGGRVLNDFVDPIDYTNDLELEEAFNLIKKGYYVFLHY